MYPFVCAWVLIICLCVQVCVVWMQVCVCVCTYTDPYYPGSLNIPASHHTKYFHIFYTNKDKLYLWFSIQLQNNHTSLAYYNQNQFQSYVANNSTISPTDCCYGNNKSELLQEIIDKL